MQRLLERNVSSLFCHWIFPNPANTEKIDTAVVDESSDEDDEEDDDDNSYFGSNSHRWTKSVIEKSGLHCKNSSKKYRSMVNYVSRY
jgi:hypothetical protein